MQSAGDRPLRELADCVTQIHRDVLHVVGEASLLQLAPLSEHDWFATLERKLVPQLSRDLFLVAAIVGGTNIGKSSLFNHLAGTNASAVSPLASGTKHPVCLVPSEFTSRHSLDAVFPGFQLQAWHQADDALLGDDTNRLFWREHAALPPNLLILDTPDIDSDARVNWERADAIRHAADVLIAVLTQQKYNDAAVKQFFRKAAAEDKALVVVFNQVQLPDDEAYWPVWLGTFCRETGCDPDLVYLVPNDRRAVANLTLPFYRRHFDAKAIGAPVTGTPAPDTRIPDTRIPDTAAPPASTPFATDEAGVTPLREELARMHFAAIKLRTLRGAIRRVVSETDGLPTFLEEVRAKSGQFTEAGRLLSSHELVRISNWPQPPNELVIGEIREWWRSHREGWTRTVHDVYEGVGQTVLWPVRWAYGRFWGADEAPDPIETYRRQEWDAALQVVNGLFAELDRLRRAGNAVLGPQLEPIVTGTARRAFLEQLQSAHAAVDLRSQLREVVLDQMERFRQESPQLFTTLRHLDTAAAAARPVISVGLFFLGGGLVDTAASSIVWHLAGDAAAGAGAVAVGEGAMTGGIEGMRYLEARLRQLHAAFARRRVGWLGDLLDHQVLGRLHSDLKRAGTLAGSEAMQRLATNLERLRDSLDSASAATHSPP